MLLAGLHQYITQHFHFTSIVRRGTAWGLTLVVCGRISCLESVCASDGVWSTTRRLRVCMFWGFNRGFKREKGLNIIRLSCKMKKKKQQLKSCTINYNQLTSPVPLVCDHLSSTLFKRRLQTRKTLWNISSRLRQTIRRERVRGDHASTRVSAPLLCVRAV